MAQRKRRVSRTDKRGELLARAARAEVPDRCDVCVVGGGAAGLVAAIGAAEQGARVVVLERDVECGRSILATGNGRCNFANARLDPALYNDLAFVRAVVGETWLDDILSFFSACGLAWAEEAEGRLYPVSRQAASVRNVLLARAERAGVVLGAAREVTSVRLAREGYGVCLTECFGAAAERELHTRTLVIATGGVHASTPGGIGAAYEAGDLKDNALALAEGSPRSRAAGGAGSRSGHAPADDDHRMLRTEPTGEPRKSAVASVRGGVAGKAAPNKTSPLAGSWGLEVRPLMPILCPLACDGSNLAALDGRRAHASVTLLRDGETVAVERGEVLFRGYGISGIAAFNLSRHARPGDVLLLDLLPSLALEDALPLASQTLDGLLDPAIARVLLQDVHTPELALKKAKAWRLAVTGLAETSRAQVMRGGLVTSQFDPATLVARELPGLFACGEALDVDGPCGGHNLAWAWKSGLVAGRAAGMQTQRKAMP